MDPLRSILLDQAGVVSRRQALASGAGPHDLARMLRRRDLARLHPGVYVDHTGPPTWLQRAWGAVLLTEPSALCDVSAVRAFDGPGRADDGGPIHVAVDRDRHLTLPDSVVAHRMTHWQDRSVSTLAPPRLSYEEATLDVALGKDDRMQVLATVAGACQRRRTTAARLRECIAARERVPERRWLVAVLTDVEEGACSVLEHGYARLVERAHGLPRPARQVRRFGTLGLAYRDVDYPDLVVELDGRLFHDNVQQREVDFDRDLDVAADGRITVRLTYGQVFDRPCRTAGRLAQVLRRRVGDALGRWAIQPCGATCRAV